MMNAAENEIAAAMLQAMPDWMAEKAAPRPPQYALISYDSELNLFITSRTDTQARGTFTELPAASKSLAGLDANYEILFSRSLLEHPRVSVFIGGEEDGGVGLTSLFWAESFGGKGAHVIVNARTWAHKIHENADELTRAHEREEAFLSSPANPALAHGYIRGHPAAWQYYDGEEDTLLNGQWETESLEAYSTDMWMDDTKGREDQIVVQLEGHIRNDDPNSHKVAPFAFNPALIGEAGTFEEAIIKLAERFYLYYTCCGEERKPALSRSTTPTQPCKWRLYQQQAAR